MGHSIQLLDCVENLSANIERKTKGLTTVKDVWVATIIGTSSSRKHKTQ